MQELVAGVVEVDGTRGSRGRVRAGGGDRGDDLGDLDRGEPEGHAENVAGVATGLTGRFPIPTTEGGGGDGAQDVGLDHVAACGACGWVREHEDQR